MEHRTLAIVRRSVATLVRRSQIGMEPANALHLYALRLGPLRTGLAPLPEVAA